MGNSGLNAHVENFDYDKLERFLKDNYKTLTNASHAVGQRDTYFFNTLKRKNFTKAGLKLLCQMNGLDEDYFNIHEPDPAPVQIPTMLIPKGWFMSGQMDGNNIMHLSFYDEGRLVCASTAFCGKAPNKATVIQACLEAMNKMFRVATGHG